jgi:GT2 family glycosyltransferase
MVDFAVQSDKPEVSTCSAGSAAQPRVSVVIVVWNAKRFVIECLETLRGQCGRVLSEVIVVDNASTDGAPELIAEMFPEFLLIRNPNNYGFARANNIGIAHCSGDYIALINSDVSFFQDCISPMVSHLEGNPAVAIAGPQMLDSDRGVCRSTMRFPTVWNSLCSALGLNFIFRGSRIFGGLMMADFDHRHTRSVEVLNGWFLLVRRNALSRVGLLDSEFFMYGEDLDWCYRFRQAGYRIEFFADAAAIHYGGSSSARAPQRFREEKCRANLRYWEKHHGKPGRPLFLASTALSHAVRLAGYGLCWLGSPARRKQASAGVAKSLSGLQWAVNVLVRHEARSEPSVS